MNGTRKPETGLQKILGYIAAIVFAFLLATGIHGCANSCPQGTIPGTPHWCK
jgi:hypothetical protein